MEMPDQFISAHLSERADATGCRQRCSAKLPRFSPLGDRIEIGDYGRVLVRGICQARRLPTGDYAIRGGILTFFHPVTSPPVARAAWICFGERLDARGGLILHAAHH